MSERRDDALHGEIVDRGVVYGWGWSDFGDRGRSRVPWFGIFLVAFGALLLLERAFPVLDKAGSLLFLALGIAFLVSWAIDHGRASLYAGAIITALAMPDVLSAAGVVSGPGLGTLCLGIAFLFIAAVRATTGGGWGWQAGLGVILAVIGSSSLALPGLGDLLWPALIVVLGVVLVVRASTARA